MLKILLDDSIVMRYLKAWKADLPVDKPGKTGNDPFITRFPDRWEPDLAIMTLCFQGQIEGWIMSSDVTRLHTELEAIVGPEEASRKITEALDHLSCLPLIEESIRRVLRPKNPGRWVHLYLKLHICQQFGLEYFVTDSLDDLKELENNNPYPVEIVSSARFLAIFRETKNQTITRIPLLDTKASYHKVYNKILAAANRVILSGRFILGKEVRELEETMAAYCHCQYAVGLSSGTDALLVALMALEVKPDDIVITTPYSFFATAGVIIRLGAIPLFVDIDRETFNLDPGKLEKILSDLASQDLAKLRAVIPVHLFGQCADMGPILAMVKQHGIAVIEDAAQAIGAKYINGNLAGSMGVMGCFSFFPSKNLGGFGDAGLITTNNRELAERVEILRSHGAQPKYFHKVLGGNFRMDTLQAAMIQEKLPYLEEWTEMRQSNAHFYSRRFKEIGLDSIISLPQILPGCFHVFNQYVIRTPQRDALKAFLSHRGVETEIYYPVPFHLQECLAHLGYRKGDFPESEKAAQETLALPVFPGLTEEMQEYVVEGIRAFYS